MATLRYTTDEIIALLKHTKINTIVVEGKDDIDVIRDLESRILQRFESVDFLFAGDKNSVLKIWAHKHEFKNSSVGFLVDSDLWLFTNDREAYPGVIFTKGYSIENICLVCPGLLALCNARNGTATAWTLTINNLVKWFSAEVSYYLSKFNPILDIGINQILDANNNFDLTKTAENRIHNAPNHFNQLFHSNISSNPLQFIRGKQLLMAMNTVIEKCEGNKISIKTLRAIGSKQENTAIDQLILDIANALGLSEKNKKLI